MSGRSKSLVHICRLFPVYAGLVLVAACRGKHPQSTFHPVTDYGRQLNALFANTFIWTMVVLAVVWIVLLVVIIRFREQPGAPTPTPVHGSTKLEIAWTIGPALIVGFIAIPTIRGIFETQAKAPASALVVEVIGHQWWWEYRYPELGIVTANELHVPTGRTVDLVMHSADVIHSFWIPRLGGKRDVNPQPATTPGEREKVNHIVFKADIPGDYPGQCAEFCGASHALMRARAEVHSPRDFQEWAASMKTSIEPPPGSQEAKGKLIFTSHMCIACHTVAGTSAAGKIGPNLTGVGSRRTVGAGVLPMSKENLARWISDPQSVKPGAKMPGTKTGAAGMPPTALGGADVIAVAAYLFSLK